MNSTSKNKHGRFLPEDFDIAHDLCFTIHDVMLQVIKSGEEGGFFRTKIDLGDGEAQELEEIGDIFEWLEAKSRYEDRAKILATTILPAILSDSLHCIYESLECSRKAKLSITYMLVRKPIQENLYVLESMVLDNLNFANTLASDSLRLRPKNAGGVEGHKNRISKVLEVIGETERLDAGYIAQLRYDKKSEDSFDGICNHAMHLFTEHPAIKTDNLNINFIFSGWEQKWTQWDYLYSRLPYLLFYMHRVVEHIIGAIAPTSPEYLDDISRRISAFVVLWWRDVEEHYKSEELRQFYEKTEKWLNWRCTENGCSLPSLKDIRRMSETGAFPGESLISLKKRNFGYSINSALNKRRANRKKWK
ncbi:hypothetical protein [Marinobacter oulmenensis]|uniref:Uncharacterized protein n=1 Tax=Marinobacter oulmenensis TaxID=643747 RepID=A0A840U5A5_9GAMM|nr:hypothetical protein [Marinobacter oulmenensis]MBB5320319.1 hypothetical protein [Marinobacter oulmenensis]